MRTERQIKVRGTVDRAFLLKLGVESLGQVTQKDTYLAGRYTWRIREEGGQYIFAQKGHDVGTRARVKKVVESIISKHDADELMKTRGVRVIVYKTSSIFRLRDVVIACDSVEHLGDFTEIRAPSEKKAFTFLQKIGFDAHDSIKESYLDMMIAHRLPPLVRRVLALHQRIGELSFGITSGILTTVGVLVGMQAATASTLAVIASIATIAVADSFSDAFGMYISKVGERGSTKNEALRYALGTFIGKFIFPLTFIVPLTILPLVVGIWVDITWGGVALALLSAEQAIVIQESVVGTIARNIGLAAIIIIFSTVVGNSVSLLM